MSLPSSDSWIAQLRPYVKDKAIFTCPTVKRQGKQYGYAFNRNLSGTKTSAIGSPTREILIFESSNLRENASDPVSSVLQSPRHGSILLAHADGSVGVLP